MARTQARRRLRWSSFSEKTFWLLVSSARMSFLCHPGGRMVRPRPHSGAHSVPRAASRGQPGAQGRQGGRRPHRAACLMGSPGQPPHSAPAGSQDVAGDAAGGA